MKSLHEKLNGSYVEVGNVQVPAIVSVDTNYEIGIWGQRHKEYLKENHRVIYFTLLTQGKLNSYLHDMILEQKNNMICLLSSLPKVKVLPNSSKQKIKYYGHKR